MAKYFQRLGILWTAFVLLLSLQAVQYEDTISYKPWPLIALIAIYLISIFLFTWQPVEKKLIVNAIILSSLWEITLGIWQFLFGHSYHYLYLATGSFFNPGPYSAYVIVGIIASLSELKSERQRLNRLLYWIVVFSGAFILLITFSRSAFIATGLIVIWLYRKQLYSYRYICFLSFFAIGILLFILKYDSAMGRLIIWRVSWLIFLKHPIIGTGNFKAAYGEGLRQFFSNEKNISSYANYADVTDFAFNDLLQMLVEYGIVIWIVFICFIAVSLYNLKNKSMTVYYSMIALIIFSLFSYPFQLFPYQLLFILISAWGNCKKNSCIISLRMRWTMYFFLLVTCYTGIFAANKVYENRKKQKEYRKLIDTRFQCRIKGYYELFSSCEKNEMFLFDFAKLLRENKRYRDSNALLRSGMLVSHDPMFLVVMGNNYKDMGFYEEADSCYHNAFLTMPNRMYPLYKRMHLQVLLTNQEKATSLCKKIISFEPKINSLATKQMKEQTVQILDSLNNHLK